MYGLWVLVGTFMGYYGLLDLGLSTAVSRHIAGAIGASDQDECNKVFSTAFFVYMAIAMVALLITLGLRWFAPLFSENQEDIATFQKIILILGLHLTIGIPLRTFQGILVAQLRFDLISIIQLMTLVLRTTLVVIVLSAGYKLLALAWVTFLAGVPQHILYVFYAKKLIPSLQLRYKECTKVTVKKLVNYSAYTFIARIADILRFKIDYIVIAAFVSLSAVTHYKIAGYIMINYIYIVVAFLGVLQPVFSRLDGSNDQQSIKKILLFTTKISICISSFIGFGLIVWGKPFIERWMGAQFLDAYPALVVLALGCMFSLWQNPSVSLLFGTSNHKFFAIFNSVEGLSNLIISLLLVRHFGLMGVALGTFIPMTIVKLLIQPVYVCRVFSIKYFEYMRILMRTVLFVFLALVIPSIISFKLASPDYLVLFLIGGVSLALYSVCLWFSAFSPLELQKLRSALFPKLSFFGKSII
jgi:O-antigen/teichoic acid export membrane protein